MGIRHVPEHKRSLKSGPRGESLSATPETITPATPATPVVEVEKQQEIETVTETEFDAPAVEETVVLPVVEEKPVATETKAPVSESQNARKKKF